MAIGSIAIFALSVGIWFVVQLASYDPSRTDDSRVILYTREFLSNPSFWFESQGPFLQYATYMSLVSLTGWDALVLIPLFSSVVLALFVGHISQRIVGGGHWTFLVAAITLASLPIFLRQARFLPFYPQLFYWATLAYGRQSARKSVAFQGPRSGKYGLVASKVPLRGSAPSLEVRLRRVAPRLTGPR